MIENLSIQLFHLAALLCYAFVLVCVADVLSRVNRVTNTRAKTAIKALLIPSTIAPLAFLVAETGGLLYPFTGSQCDALALLWFIFHLANAAVYVAFLGAVRVYLTWRPASCADAPRDCPRRQVDDCLRTHPADA